MRLTRVHTQRSYITHRKEIQLFISHNVYFVGIGTRVSMEVKNLLRICFNLNESYFVRTE